MQIHIIATRPARAAAEFSRQAGETVECRVVNDNQLEIFCPSELGALRLFYKRNDNRQIVSRVFYSDNLGLWVFTEILTEGFVERPA